MYVCNSKMKIFKYTRFVDPEEIEKFQGRKNTGLTDGTIERFRNIEFPHKNDNEIY